MSRPGPVLVVGEAIVDLGPDQRRPGAAIDPGAMPMIAHAGGSPANVAVGLARLSVPTAFAGRLSGRGLGPWLRAYLEANRVDTTPCVHAAEDCSLAVVAVDAAGGATYTFYVEGTADWQWRPEELPAAGFAAVHTGSLAAAMEPGAAVLASWLTRVREAGQAFVSLDPNVRPSLISDLETFRARLAGLLPQAHLVKVSEEDLGILFPGSDPIEVARGWVAAGPDLVVVTQGPRGATAVGSGRSGPLHRPAPAVEVVDTVGAGDAFTAGLLGRLHALGGLGPQGCAGLDGDGLADVLDFANRVAAVTCTRAGADPPRLSELP